MNDIHSTQITAAPASGRRGESRAATPPGSDKQMVAFAHRWMPYGGTADDEILVEFGLTPTQFYLRVIEILEKRDVPGHSVPPTPSSSNTATDEFANTWQRAGADHSGGRPHRE